MTPDLVRPARAVAVVLLVGLGACSAEMPWSVAPADYTVAVGQPIDITLRTIGPDAYAAAPIISGPLVTFVGVADIAPYSPGGPTQQFSFIARAPGRVVVTFTRTGTSPLSTTTKVIDIQ